MKRSGLGAGVALLLAAWVAWGAPPGNLWATGSEPLQVDSQTLEARGGEGVVIFQGDVVVHQGGLTLQADRVTVHGDPETRAIQTVDAEGGVRIQRADVVAVGEAAQYDAVSGIVILTGSPKVWRGRDVVAGERITLYLAENRSVVDGARAVLYPTGQTGDEAPE